jgi:hypothetical protein
VRGARPAVGAVRESSAPGQGHGDHRLLRVDDRFLDGVDDLLGGGDADADLE